MMGHYQLRNPDAEKRAYKSRLYLSLVFALLLGLVLVWRYMNLQVVQYQRFITESDRNRIHTQPLAPRRGLIVDRNGVLLAENQPSFSLAITRERVPNLDHLLTELQQLFDIDEKTIKKFKHRRRTPYQAVPLKFRLNDDEIGRFAVNRHRLPGVEIKAQLVRSYPLADYFAHVIGYVGRINTAEQDTLFSDKAKRINYAATDHIGKLGLEKFYESILHGEVGSQYAETNAHGRVLRVLEKHSPIPGADLRLSVDAKLQQLAHKKLDGRRGSVVVIDVKTGDILAMVSTPAYDPNPFVTGISNKAYAKLRDSNDLPLFNRSLQGQYPPGSTIKPFVGLAGLHYRVVHSETTVVDPGWYQLPNDERYYRDWKKGGHGAHINLHAAIAQSCDVYFYDLAYKLGVDRIHEYLSHFGLGRKTNIDSTGERAGLLPSRDWKKRYKQEQWYPGETLSIGIGQGYMLATPLQLAVATATLANRGVAVQPRLVVTTSANSSQANALLENRDSINSPVKNEKFISVTDNQLIDDSVENSIGHNAALTKQNSQKESGKKTIQSSNEAQNNETQIASRYHWDLIHKAMEAVVHSSKGTARAIGHSPTYRMAGKTGTAQVIGIAQNAEYDKEAIAERQRDHALFVGFAPLHNPKVAVAVIVENGGSGSSTAAPIAREIFDWVLHNEKTKVRPKLNELPWYAGISDANFLTKQRYEKPTQVISEVFNQDAI